MPKRLRNSLKDKFPEVTSIRLPDGLKRLIDRFVDKLNSETGIQLSRSEFIVTSIEYYLRYLVDAKNHDEMVTRIENFYGKN